jgi:predicted NUDIX family phosphoesterase
MLGLVNEELTSLGRVHIGVVFVQRCERGGSACSTELSGLEWVSLEDLSHFTSCNNFEKWSLLAMEILTGRTDDPRG